MTTTCAASRPSDHAVPATAPAPPAPQRALRFCDHELELGSPELGRLRDANDLLDDGAALRERMAEDGYLVLRGLLPRSRVERARAVVLETLEQGGQLDRSRPVSEGILGRAADGQPLPWFPEYFGGRKEITHTAGFLGMAECPEFFAFFQTLFGEPARTFDYKWLRAVRSNPRAANPHYDVVFMGRGEVQRLYTCWTPLGDIAPENGPLAVLSGSHRLESYRRVHETYGRADVDRDNIESSFSRDPLEIVRTYGGQWQTSGFAMGDVLVFGMHTMHAALTNLTDRVRISADLRFQPASARVDERWIGEKPISNYAWNRTPAVPIEVSRKAWGV